LAKARKTPEEVAAIRSVHVHDGAAIVRFLHWFSENALNGFDEWSLAGKLAEYREQADGYRSPSFRTISAFGPNAAAPHYTVEPGIALPVTADNLYLVDSGSQYQGGTTDITRVACVGTPSDEMRERYTQVLRGHIALGEARFIEGTTGAQLDPFARQFLWAAGVDFDHGTGHGVGCYLAVHEGPQNISRRATDVPLEPGMILSNEPGYYKPGEFGIRIENLLVVVVVEPQPPGAEVRTLGFDTLTLCPYDRALIATETLTDRERRAIDDYHARVYALLAASLPADTRSWLAAATAPLPQRSA
jgi:Xaa-Pro aminopeptidase